MTEPTNNTADAVAGYQSAVALACAEAGTAWSKLTAFIYAHTIIILTIGLSLTNDTKALHALALFLALLGVVLCIAWHLLTRLSFAWYAYWLKSARAHESSLSLSHRTLEHGAHLSDGAAVTFTYSDGSNESFALPKVPKIRSVASSLIAAFGLLYAALLIYIAVR